MTLLEKSTCRPLIHHHNNFYGHNQLPGTLIPLNTIFQRLKTMLNVWGGSTRENGRVNPYSYIGDIFNVQIRDQEAQRPREGEFDRILRILKNCRVFGQRERMRYFYFVKQAQSTWKPAHTYFQIFEKLTSRLAPTSESGGPKIEKVWRRVCRVSTLKFLKWKNQRVRCKKRFQIGYGQVGENPTFLIDT